MIVEHLQVSWCSGFSKQKFLLGTMKGESFTFLSVLPRTARERVIKVFSTTWTRRIAPQHPISRVMYLDALVKIWSSLHSKINDLKAEMDRYLQCLLTRAKIPSKYHIVLILLKKLGEYFNYTLSFCSNLRNLNFRAHIARWCAENNRPHKIVKDHFKIIMKAG